MTEPVLYISAQCVKITQCTNNEAKSLGIDIITPEKNVYNSDKDTIGYLIQYKRLNCWRTSIDARYIPFANYAKDNLAQIIFNNTKNLN